MPRNGEFFRQRDRARIRDHAVMMMKDGKTVNRHRAGRIHKKKPGSKEPGLRYWPREADTITFQEGLLSARIAGGGGQKRDTTTQYREIMIHADGVQQAQPPHVSHAETGGCRAASIRTASAAPC
jgi:hypothetical protein